MKVINVSIPFEQESVSKVVVPCNAEAAFAFRFPSPGKVSPKDEDVTIRNGRIGLVSIPFHWESVSKAAACKSSNSAV